MSADFKPKGTGSRYIMATLGRTSKEVGYRLGAVVVLPTG